MSNELHYRHDAAGLSTLYAVLYSGTGTAVVKASDGTLVALNATNWPDAALAGSDTGHVRDYYASIPAATPAGAFTVIWFVKAGATPANTDAAASGPASFFWTGTAVIDGQCDVQAVNGDADAADSLASLMGTTTAGTLTSNSFAAGALEPALTAQGLTTTRAGYLDSIPTVKAIVQAQD